MLKPAPPSTAEFLPIESQQRQLQNLQDMLLHSLSHDLGTPAMTILGFTDLLLADHDNSPDPQVVRQYLEHIRNSANRQVSLIAALTKYCQLSQQPLSLSCVDLTALITECNKERPDLAELSSYRFELHPTPTNTGDPIMLKLVMQALLDNAIKFTRKISCPVISFGAEFEAEQLVYFLTDNGVGFKVERKERLFQPFCRLHSSKDYEGIGMGLAIAATIIRRHDGRIWAHSDGENGMTVRFTLGAKP
ncbi:MAG: ATP-binding protein [Steroidobacteraceae bacterium]